MNTGSTTDWLTRKLMRYYQVDSNAGVAKSQVKCLLIWTTFVNIDCWFHNWGQFLVGFGFGTIQDNGKVVVLDEQKSCILNLDESALLLDGSTQQLGGHLTVSFYDGALWIKCSIKFAVIDFHHRKHCS